MSRAAGWSAQLDDWVDSLTPQQARDFMSSKVEIEQCGTDSHTNRPIFRQKAPLTMRALSRIYERANS